MKSSDLSFLHQEFPFVSRLAGLYSTHWHNRFESSEGNNWINTPDHWFVRTWRENSCYHAPSIAETQRSAQVHTFIPHRFGKLAMDDAYNTYTASVNVEEDDSKCQVKLNRILQR